MDPRPGVTTLVRYHRIQMDVLWGGGTLLFGVVGVMAARGAETTLGAIVGTLFGGGISALCLFMWVDSRRHPQQLEIGAQEIVHGYRGKPRKTRLSRDVGSDLELRLRRTGQSAAWYLSQPGSDAVILLQAFHPAEVRQACLDRGWRFVDEG